MFFSRLILYPVARLLFPLIWSRNRSYKAIVLLLWLYTYFSISHYTFSTNWLAVALREKYNVRLFFVNYCVVDDFIFFLLTLTASCLLHKILDLIRYFFVSSLNWAHCPFSSDLFAWVWDHCISTSSLNGCRSNRRIGVVNSRRIT